MKQIQNPRALLQKKQKKINFLQSLEKFLLFLVILFLPTQLGKHFWLEFSYVYSLKIDYLSPTLYFWDLLFYLLLIVWFVNKPIINKKALTVLMFFLLSQIVTLFFAVNVGGGLFRLYQLITVSLFGLLIASYNFSDLNKQLVKGLGLAILVQSAISISQFFFSRSIGLWILGERSFSINTPTIAIFDFFGQRFLRPYGTFSHPNVLAGFMVICLPLFNLLNTDFKGVWPKIVSSLGFITTILSFARVSILVLILETIVYLKSHLRILIILFLVLLPFLFIRFNSAFNFDNLTLIRREELASISLSFFYSDPIFGVGLNNFINEVASSSLVSGPNRFLQPVHNIFLLTAAEAGFIGLSGFLLLLIMPIYKLINETYSYKKTFLGLWLIIIFLGLFDHYFLTLPQGQRLLFLIWGLSMISSKGSED